jgi:hypothetical protein
MKRIEQMWWSEHTIWQDDVAGWWSRPPLSATRRLSASKWHWIKDAWNVIMVEGHVMWMTTPRDASILWSGKNEILTKLTFPWSRPLASLVFTQPRLAKYRSDVIFKTAQFEKIMMQLFAVLVLLMLRWLWEENHCIDPHLLFGFAVVDFRRNMIDEILCFAFSQEDCKTRINTADLRVQVHQRNQNADVIKSHIASRSAVRLIPKATDFRRNLVA